MKKLILIFTSVFLSTFIGSAQTDSENEVINDIRSKFKIINNNCNSYEKVDKDLMGHSTEGGNIKAFYDKTDLKKIIAYYYGETGKVINEYYLWDDKVFFIFTRNFVYNSPITMTINDPSIGLEAYDESKTKIKENRYYFSKNKLIQWMDPDKKKVNRESKEFLDKQTELLEDIEFIKSKL